MTATSVSSALCDKAKGGQQLCCMSCSVPLDGKNKAVDCHSVDRLIKLLKDESADVRANAAGAIMT